jgi:hypothetical protein
MRSFLPLFCLVVFLYCSTRTSFGQNIQVAGKLGFATTNFEGDKDTDFDGKFAVTGGFAFTYPINRNLAFAPEIDYAAKGAETVATIDNVPLELDFSVLYLEFPLLGKYTLSPRNKISPIVTAGPVVSWNIDSRVRFNAVGSDTQFNEPDDSIRTLDYGVAVGGGVEFSWNLRRVTIEARYVRGISNIIDKKEDPKHNSAIALTAGVGL